jgi:hypothetical protein
VINVWGNPRCLFPNASPFANVRGEGEAYPSGTSQNVMINPRLVLQICTGMYELKFSLIDSKEALEFINSLFDEKRQLILNELEESIFSGFWEDIAYKEISAKAFRSEQYVRDTGAKLCKRIKEDLGISVSKRNFKNPIEYRYNQQASEQASPSQSDSNTTRLTSPPTPLLPGEGSKDSPLPCKGRGAVETAATQTKPACAGYNTKLRSKVSF